MWYDRAIGSSRREEGRGVRGGGGRGGGGGEGERVVMGVVVTAAAVSATAAAERENTMVREGVACCSFSSAAPACFC